jgi:hypothetical protein
METPGTPQGSRSGVHCRRLNVLLILVAMARARMVLPARGTSFSRMWPSTGGEDQFDAGAFANDDFFAIIADGFGKGASQAGRLRCPKWH